MSIQNQKLLMYSDMYHRWVEIEVCEKLDDGDAIIEYLDPVTNENKRMIYNIVKAITVPVGSSVGAPMQRFAPVIAKDKVQCDCCDHVTYDYEAKMTKDSDGEYLSLAALTLIAKLQAKLINAGIEL